MTGTVRRSIAVSSAFFFMLYIMLSIHVRPAMDDFYFIGLAREYRPIQSMLYQYHHWSGRWATHLAAGFFFTYLPVFKVPMIISFISCTALLHVINYFTRKVTQSKTDSFLLASLFLTSVFFSTINIGEGFFWTISVLGYLWSVIALLQLIQSVFFGRNIFFNYILIIISAAYIGGASENYAVLSLVFLAAVYFLFGNKKQLILVLIAIITLLISFTISIFSEGTAIRSSALPVTDVTLKIMMFIGGMGYLFIKGLILKLPYLILFSLPVFILAATGYFSGWGEVSKKTLRKVFLLFLLSSLLILSSVGVMSERGPDRALNIFSFLVTALFFFLAFYKRKAIRKKIFLPKNKIAFIFYASNFSHMADQ